MQIQQLILLNIKNIVCKYQEESSYMNAVINNVANKKRQSNMELLRIVSMMFIIIHHININGIGWTNVSTTNLAENRLLYNTGSIFEAFVIIGVNLFFLLSGYFQINFKWKKFLSIILTVYVYTVLIQFVGILTGYNKINMDLLKRILTPFNAYWFLKVYLIVMLLSPLLNIIIRHANRVIANYFLILYLAIFCIYTFFDNSERLGVTRGYSLISACCLYLIGAFINKGLILNRQLRGRYCIGIYIFFSLMNACAILMAINILENGKIASVLLSYNNPLVALSSVFLLLAFTKLKINEESKVADIIRFLSKNVLAVYILHSSNKVFVYYRDIPMKMLTDSENVVAAYVCLIPYALVIFVACIFIDKGFQKTIGRGINCVTEILEKKIKGCQNRIIKKLQEQ